MSTEMLEHLNSRYFDPTLYPGVSHTEDEVTFPLWNLSGQMVGYQVYNPKLPKNHKGNPREQKYFTWITRPASSNNPYLAVWGLESVKNNGKVIYLTEGIFDACRFHWHGLQALAVLSNNPKHLENFFFAISRRTIAVVQGDEAGKQLAKYAPTALFLPEGKDAGDLTEDEFREMFLKGD